MAGWKQSYNTPLTDVSTTLREALGVIRVENDGRRWYKYVNVKNTTATVAGAAGSLVAYGAAGGYNNNLVVVDLSDADAIVLCAGALLAVVTGTLAVNYYAWIQIKGQIVLDTAVTSAAIGKSFFLSTTDKVGTVGANAFDQKAGYSVNATTSVLLDCPV